MTPELTRMTLAELTIRKMTTKSAREYRLVCLELTRRANKAWREC